MLIRAANSISGGRSRLFRVKPDISKCVCERLHIKPGQYGRCIINQTQGPRGENII